MNKTTPDTCAAIAQRLTTYSAVAAATAATAGLASAEEVIWDIPDITVGDPDNVPGSPVGGVLFNVVTGATASAPDNDLFTTEGRFRLLPDFNGYIYGPTVNAGVGNLGFVGSVGQFTYTSTNGATSTYSLPLANPLQVGVPIGAADTFAISPPFENKFYAYLSFSDGDTAIVGLRFDLGSDVHFGWAQITRVDDDNFTLHGFGYNDTPNATTTSVNTVDGMPGDTDGDGDIDDSDLGTSFANYTGPVGGVGGKTRAQGDTDGDGDVDDSDLGTSFAGYTGPLGQAQVPEPSSLLLLAAGAYGLAGWRKRHATG